LDVEQPSGWRRWLPQRRSDEVRFDFFNMTGTGALT
jgi:hypothetical protein